MCALRNTINFKTCCFYLFAALLQITACSTSEDTNNNKVSTGTAAHSNANAYLPLVVGNKWEYECSVEGEHAFDKTLTITAVENNSGIIFYRGELQVDDDSVPLIKFYSIDDHGSLFSSLNKSNKDRALIITANPKDGETVNGLFVRKAKKIDIPNLGKVKAILVENFELDNPKLNESQRMDWEGKYYARGIGLVVEADGLGGECVLKKFSSAAEKQK